MYAILEDDKIIVGHDGEWFETLEEAEAFGEAGEYFDCPIIKYVKFL